MIRCHAYCDSRMKICIVIDIRLVKMEGKTMQKMGLNEIRQKFLDFFESKDHYVESSYPLVPQNDKSLLLINAGMAPLKNYFTGAEKPPKVRMATCQKCIRTGDIENVGYTSRHGTFFEMLGNFSFGDYFKEGSIKWGWEFLTEVLELPVEDLWPSVYLEDDEAYAIWRDVIGIPEEKITRLGKEDNFWEIGQGPCGPCSEIYVDRGVAYGCNDPDCKPGCECDRFIEIWNHVFTQFNRTESGEYENLAKKNIDTGMGLERVACVMQGVDSIFEVDTIKAIIDSVVKLSGKPYGVERMTDVSTRIITDHIRACSFLICDGVMPNNEGRGYVLRRLLRRAARHGKLLGIEGAFLTDLVDVVVELSGEAYPDLVARHDYIKKILLIEEERFQQTIDQGLSILKEYIVELEKQGEKTLSGENAFKLYDTYGFPLDLTKEILEEKEMQVDEEAFTKEMEDQRNRARSARADGDDLGWEDDAFSGLSDDVTTEFVGYDRVSEAGVVSAISVGPELVQEAKSGEKVRIILDRTPFYAEGGGQVGDHGELTTNDAVVIITDTKKGSNGTFIHQGEVKSGSVKVGENVMASVDHERRLDIARNHTATHLVHKALKMVLGDHVEQAGSLVGPDRMRFDFSHFQAMTSEELAKVEAIVNEKVFMPHEVSTAFMGIKEAKAMGATALFGEKYGAEVRVVRVGEFSIELCGGTHLHNTSEVGVFKILSESGIAAGVRRIEVITGRKVYEYMNSLDIKLHSIADELKASVHDVVEKAGNINAENKKLQKEIESMKAKAASESSAGLIDKALEVNGFKLITEKLNGVDANTMRTMGDQIKDKLDKGVVVLASDLGGKVLFLAMATEDAVKAGAHAGKLVGEVAKVAGGGGGGRPNMAQAGGKDPAKIEDALKRAIEVVEAY